MDLYIYCGTVDSPTIFECERWKVSRMREEDALGGQITKENLLGKRKFPVNFAEEVLGKKGRKRNDGYFRNNGRLESHHNRKE